MVLNRVSALTTDHERVARAAAQTLRARQQVHEIGVVPGTGLYRAPGQVVERFIVLPRRGIERKLPALLPRPALGATRLILEYLGSRELQERLRAGALARARTLSTDVVIPRYEQMYRELTGVTASADDVAVGG